MTAAMHNSHLGHQALGVEVGDEQPVARAGRIVGQVLRAEMSPPVQMPAPVLASDAWAQTMAQLADSMKSVRSIYLDPTVASVSMKAVPTASLHLDSLRSLAQANIEHSRAIGKELRLAQADVTAELREQLRGLNAVARSAESLRSRLAGKFGVQPRGQRHDD